MPRPAQEIEVINPKLISKVLKAAAKASEIDEDTLFSESLPRKHVHTRWAMWSAVREHGHSYPAIGNAFERHHTTVMSGIRNFRKMLGDDDLFRVFKACQRAIETHHRQQAKLAAQREAKMREREAEALKAAKAEARRLERERAARMKEEAQRKAAEAAGFGAPRSAKAQALLKEYETSQKRTRAFMEKPGFARGRDD